MCDKLNKDDLISLDEIVDGVIAFETGEMDVERLVRFFSKLAKNNIIHQFQGIYGRMYRDLQEGGFLTENGDVNEEVLSEYQAVYEAEDG